MEKVFYDVHVVPVICGATPHLKTLLNPNKCHIFFYLDKSIIYICIHTFCCNTMQSLFGILTPKLLLCSPSALPVQPAETAWSLETGFTTSMAVYSVNMIDPQLSSMAI